MNRRVAVGFLILMLIQIPFSAAALVETTFLQGEQSHPGGIAPEWERARESTTFPETSLKRRARRAADRYILSDKVFYRHILERHGPKSSVPGKSRFLKGFDIRSGIDFVLKSPEARIQANTEGRSGYLFEYAYRKPIGVSPERKPLKRLKVVIDEAGRVITAYPVR